MVARAGICYRTLQYPDSQVNKLEITADKSQIAAAGNSQIRIYDVNSNDPQPINSFEGHNGNVTALGFQKDSKWMYSGAGSPRALHGGGREVLATRPAGCSGGQRMSHAHGRA